jgi:methionine-rich copper-binding protein CopC
MKKLLLSAGLVALLIIGGLPAQGHSQLVSANPRPGSVLNSSPASVKLQFNEDLINLSASSNLITIQDSRGRAIETSATLVQGSLVSVSLPKKLRVGRYSVRWRVVSADGHPIAGRFSFTIRK